jgi:hypothetical protein
MSLPMVLRLLTTYFPSDTDTTIHILVLPFHNGAALIPGVPVIPVAAPFWPFLLFCRSGVLIVPVVAAYRLFRQSGPMKVIGSANSLQHIAFCSDNYLKIFNYLAERELFFTQDGDEIKRQQYVDHHGPSHQTFAILPTPS